MLDAQIRFESRPGDQGYLLGAVLFLDGSSLYFREFLVAEDGMVSKVAYSYHYQDADAQLIFRYDNARHRPAFPELEHKHTRDAVEVSPSPSLDAVLENIVAILGWI